MSSFQNWISGFSWNSLLWMDVPKTWLNVWWKTTVATWNIFTWGCLAKWKVQQHKLLLLLLLFSVYYDSTHFWGTVTLVITDIYLVIHVKWLLYTCHLYSLINLASKFLFMRPFQFRERLESLPSFKHKFLRLQNHSVACHTTLPLA